MWKLSGYEDSGPVMRLECAGVTARMSGGVVMMHYDNGYGPVAVNHDRWLLAQMQMWLRVQLGLERRATITDHWETE